MDTISLKVIRCNKALNKKIIKTISSFIIVDLKQKCLTKLHSREKIDFSQIWYYNWYRVT